MADCDTVGILASTAPGRNPQTIAILALMDLPNSFEQAVAGNGAPQSPHGQSQSLLL